MVSEHSLPYINTLLVQVDVGVIDDIQFGNPKSPRFVYWDKKLRATPSGPDVLTFDLLSIGGKLRAGMGLLGLRPKMPGQLKTNPKYRAYSIPSTRELAISRQPPCSSIYIFRALLLLSFCL